MLETVHSICQGTFALARCTQNSFATGAPRPARWRSPLGGRLHRPTISRRTHPNPGVHPVGPLAGETFRTRRHSAPSESWGTTPKGHRPSVAKTADDER